MSLNPYQEAVKLAEGGPEGLNQAWKIINFMLIEDPVNYHALVTGSYILRRMGRLPESFHLAMSSTRINARDSGGWTNLGHTASEMWLPEQAEKCYETALKYARDPEHQFGLWLNLSALYLDNGMFDKAEEWVKLILESKPDYDKAQANMGFIQLAKRNWAEGWRLYHKTIGSDWRRRVIYKGEPEWDGSAGKTVVLYSDQGLGDEISFASMVPDALKRCKKLIMDCEPRLANLFRRSFPGAKVYGTRKVRDAGHTWDVEDWQIDASLPLGQAGEFFRLADSDFPGTPYLVPCPQRTAMWRSYFSSIGKPAIGVAWRGGIPRTNMRNRKLKLNDLLPVFKTINAQFVCLQYRDAADEIEDFKKEHPEIDLVQYPWATLTDDYDDTAALVAALDQVLCIQTAIAHTAGALGIPVTVLVPKATQWRYGEHYDSVPWYHSLKIIRQEDHGSWEREITRAAQSLAADLGRLSADAGADARDDSALRDGGGDLRADRLGDYRPNGGQAPAGLRLRA